MDLETQRAHTIETDRATLRPSLTVPGGWEMVVRGTVDTYTSKRDCLEDYDRRFGEEDPNSCINCSG